jgi:hypothetical protein
MLKARTGRKDRPRDDADVVIARGTVQFDRAHL